MLCIEGMVDLVKHGGMLQLVAWGCRANKLAWVGTWFHMYVASGDMGGVCKSRKRLLLPAVLGFGKTWYPHYCLMVGKRYGLYVVWFVSLLT
jgi:hypothetical protein